MRFFSKVVFAVLLTRQRPAIARHGMTVTCDLSVGERAWKLVWSGGIPPLRCGSRWRCDCEVALRGGHTAGAGYLILRGVPEERWCHSRSCDVCISPLGSLTLDCLLSTVLPSFVEGQRGGVPLSTRWSSPWRPTYVWRHKLYTTLHWSMLGCVRRSY